MKKIFLISIFILEMFFALPKISQAACTGASPTWICTPDYASINNLLNNNTPAGLQVGDTVNVSAGSATWTEGLYIHKGVILKGAGIGQTIITASANCSCLEGKDQHNPTYFIKYHPSDYSLNAPFRLSGFTFDLGNKCAGLSLGKDYYPDSRDAAQMAAFVPQDKVRIDHTRWTNIPQIFTAHYVWNYCNMYAVIDSSIFENGMYPFKNDSQGVEYQYWNHPIGSQYEIGSKKFTYFEDNVVTFPQWDGGIGEAQYSGRYAMRYNTINYPFATGVRDPSTGQTVSRIQALTENHGPVPGAQMGGVFGVELYGNQVNAALSLWLLHTGRGGECLVFDNNISSPQGLVTQNKWHHSAVTCPTDPNQPAGYAAQTMIHDTYAWGSRTAVNGTTGTIITSYVEGPTEGGPPNLSCAGRENIPQLGRDVFSDNSNPGVTCGTLANRPATCATGQGYWATTQSCSDLAGMVGASTEVAGGTRNPNSKIIGTLYKCTAPNIWQSFYTPYAYPHPLRTDCVSYPTLCDSSICTTPGDFDCNTKFDALDISSMINIILKLNPTQKEISKGDMNTDNKVDSLDLNALINEVLK